MFQQRGQLLPEPVREEEPLRDDSPRVPEQEGADAERVQPVHARSDQLQRQHG